MKSKRLAFYGSFLGLALILSYIESLIPFCFGVPGMKLGLCNVIVVVLLYTAGPVPALLISVARVILSGFLFGNMFSIIYSMAGALLSFACMVLIKKCSFALPAVSVVGGVTHNLGQIIVAILVVENYNLMLYFPLLILAGIVTGFLIGEIAGGVYRIIGPYYKKEITS